MPIPYNLFATSIWGLSLLGTYNFGVHLADMLEDRYQHVDATLDGGFSAYNREFYNLIKGTYLENQKCTLPLSSISPSSLSPEVDELPTLPYYIKPEDSDAWESIEAIKQIVRDNFDTKTNLLKECTPFSSETFIPLLSTPTRPAYNFEEQTVTITLPQPAGYYVDTLLLFFMQLADDEHSSRVKACRRGEDFIGTAIVARLLRCEIFSDAKEKGVRNYDILHTFASLYLRATFKAIVIRLYTLCSYFHHALDIVEEKTETPLFSPEKATEIITYLKEKLVFHDLKRDEITNEWIRNRLSFLESIYYDSALTKEGLISEKGLLWGEHKYYSFCRKGKLDSHFLLDLARHVDSDNPTVMPSSYMEMPYC